MKVILIDAVMYGHHQAYFEALMDGLSTEHQVIGTVPSEYENPRYHLIQLDLYKENMDVKATHILAYLQWMWNLCKIVKREKPDVVHFLYGDVLYRYFGAGLHFLGHAKVIVTFHQVRRSRLRDRSIKRICRYATQVVLHTDKLVEDLKVLGIRNVKKVEYPCFGRNESVGKEDAQKALGIDSERRPVLLALGGTRYDKGLDILLEALDQVEAPFYLLIAGYPEQFDEEYIRANTGQYRDRVKYILKYLSDEELSLCFAAADFVVLPYRKVFDGASGPLGEGVARNKVVIGPNHGSLGRIIEENHLGYVFETENVRSLAQTIQKALNQPYERDERYQSYQKELSAATFVANYQEIYKEEKK